MTGMVRLLTTGGTIATKHDPRLGSNVALGGSDLVRGISRRVDVDLAIQELSRAPSWQIGPDMMHEIAVAACEAAKDPAVDGVVVTHGTTTLEYTAFLADLYLAVDSPVVFTGAMRPADAMDSDGPRNLLGAIAVAAEPKAKDLGSVVCFGQQIFASRDVYKARRSGPDAFIGLEGSLGTVDEGTVHIVRRPARSSHSFRPSIETRVALIKAFPGCDGSLLDSALESGVRGVVLEGLPGAGGLPTDMQKSVARAASQGIPVVISSRAPFGRIGSPPTGGTGEPLQDMRVISAGDLTAEKAWVLLMVVLGQGGDFDAVAQEFARVADQ